MIVFGSVLCTCDECGHASIFSSFSSVRAFGWSVSHDRKKCWCPRCAANHRRGRPRKNSSE